MVCSEITEEDRQEIFQNYWGMSRAEKKVFVQLLTIKKSTARHRDGKMEFKSRRCNSMIYFLPNSDMKIQGCQKLFLSTLDISDYCVLKWKKDAEKDRTEESVDVSPQVEKRREVFQLRKYVLNKFLNRLQRMESRDCRADTEMVYLEPLWTSKSELYREYQRWCREEENVEPLSSAVFDHEFENQKLGIFSPKKDLCHVCVGYETGNMDQDEYDKHIERKKAGLCRKTARHRKRRIRLHGGPSGGILSPRSNVSSMYYKTKLIVHNFTLYHGKCFLWNECEGNITANEFATVIFKFVERVIEENGDAVKMLIFWSGECGYQNGNVTMSNTFRHLSTIYKDVAFQQKYLIKGYTHMEVDSIHANIKKVLEKTVIRVPADYIDIIGRARPPSTFGKYQTYYLPYNYFCHCSPMEKYKSIRPGSKKGDPTVNEIVASQYLNGAIVYKPNFDESWTALPKNVHIKRGLSRPTTVKQLYSKQLPIPKSKFSHLQELKKSLPSDFHSFYDSLPYIRSNKSVEPCAEYMKQNVEIYAKDVVKKSSAGKKRKAVQEPQNVDEPKVVKKKKKKKKRLL